MPNTWSRRRLGRALGTGLAARAAAGAGVGAGVGVGAGGAFAQSGGRLVVGNWGGDSERVLKDYLIAPHLTPGGMEVVFDTASESPRKVKLLAERALPRGTMDVAGLTRSGCYDLWKNGAAAEIDFSQIKNAGRILPSVAAPYYVPQLYSIRVLLYNDQYVRQAPSSYADLWNPALAGKVGVIDIQYQSTIESAALTNGGSVSNYEPGKAKLLELKKLGLKVYPTNEAMAQALQTGECWMCIMWLARGVIWQNAGIPIKIAYPKEGLGLYTTGFVIPKNARNKAGAYKFLSALLEDDTQRNLAVAFGYSPPITGVDLPGDLAKRIGIPVGMEAAVFQSDEEYLLKNDSQLKDWWDKEFKA